MSAIFTSEDQTHILVTGTTDQLAAAGAAEDMLFWMGDMNRPLGLSDTDEVQQTPEGLLFTLKEY